MKPNELVFINDRKEHVEQIIAPELKAGHIVIADRYYFSNMAYQGALGMAPEEILQRNEAFAPEPDLLVVLDIEPRIALERIKTRGDRANHFENTRALTTAREIFRNIQKPYLYLLDGTQPAEVLRDSIVRQFSRTYVEMIAARLNTASEDGLKKRLHATLALFGGDPL